MHHGAGHRARSGRTPLELADVFRAHGDQLGLLSGRQKKAVTAITRCRTAAMGGHVEQCDRCEFRQISYNSCRDRHCPKCQSLAAARWVEARRADLLPVEYFHVVFTVPQQLHPIFRTNPKIAYQLLFSAVAETLQQVALNPAHLGARIGLTAVLHTWTQKLLFHPHIHCVIPGGGLSPERDRWIPTQSGFFLPVRVLSKVFRGKLLSKFELAADKNRIESRDQEISEILRAAARRQWVVYSKPPFGGPEQVLRYLARYTHRIAISNHRILSMQDGQVTFRWRDRADADTEKLCTIDAAAFLRRFLLHVLPAGLVRIRHYGILANPVRRRTIEQCRKLMRAEEPAVAAESESWQELLLRLTGFDVTVCPRCRKGHMIFQEKISSAWIGALGKPWSIPGRATSP